MLCGAFLRRCPELLCGSVVLQFVQFVLPFALLPSSPLLQQLQQLQLVQQLLWWSVRWSARSVVWLWLLQFVRRLRWLRCPQLRCPQLCGSELRCPGGSELCGPELRCPGCSELCRSSGSQLCRGPELCGCPELRCCSQLWRCPELRLQLRLQQLLQSLRKLLPSSLLWSAERIVRLLP